MLLWLWHWPASVALIGPLAWKPPYAKKIKKEKKNTIIKKKINFKKGYSGDYGIKLTPRKLRTFCKIDWPLFGVGWPSKGSLDKEVVRKVF